MISKENFLKGIEELQDAFQYQTTPKQFETYYKYLGKEFTDATFQEAVKNIIQYERQFPAIAALIEWGNKCSPNRQPNWL